jgi:hypothetical protein
MRRSEVIPTLSETQLLTTLPKKECEYLRPWSSSLDE